MTMGRSRWEAVYTTEHDCGSLGVFDTEEEARDTGENWLLEQGPPDECEETDVYYEVVAWPACIRHEKDGGVDDRKTMCVRHATGYRDWECGNDPTEITYSDEVNEDDPRVQGWVDDKGKP